MQRFGDEVVGGSEFLCRQIAEKLSKKYQIEILTTCAKDYITWRNEYPEGTHIVNNILVRRFKTEKERDLESFQKLTVHLFNNPHTEFDEKRWLEEQGPYSPLLLQYIDTHKNDYDIFIFITYRYYPSFFGLPLVFEKSILIPTAEDEDTLKLKILNPFFRLPRALIFLTPEEQELINNSFELKTKIQDVIGMGLCIPQDIDEKRFRQKFNVLDDYLLYVGRIDPQKGCHQLFEFFSRYKKQRIDKCKLVLIGKSAINIPRDDDIIHLGFLSENDKYDGIMGAKIVLIPSEYESYSIIATEAMAIGIPILVNEKCSVLKGHCIRSNAGLFFSNYDEFFECIQLILTNKKIREKMANNGKSYVKDSYNWSKIEKKYSTILDNIA